MSNDTFTFDNVAGQPATLEVNERDSHIVITWGDLTITDASGHVGFWASFHKTSGSCAKGAARTAALHKHARQMIEAEIYTQMRCLQEELASRD